MSTSGSTDYGLTTNGILEEAFDICGIGTEGEAITADQYARALRSLNLMVKAWGASDHLWLRTERSVTLIASTASYALTPKPMRILEVRRRVTDGSTDTPLREMSQAEYRETANKTTDSVPVSFYYEPQLTTGTLYVWPRPDSTTATDMTLQLTYLRKIEDFDATSNDPDLPQEWLQALCYGLADQLAVKYVTNPQLRQEIAARALVYKQQLDSWDTEPASLFMQPEWQ